MLLSTFLDMLMQGVAWAAVALSVWLAVAVIIGLTGLAIGLRDTPDAGRRAKPQTAAVTHTVR